LLSTTSASGTSTTISSISGAYKHLRIWISDIDITTATSAQLRFRFNGDTAANYPNFYTGSDAVNKADNTIGYLTNDRAHSKAAAKSAAEAKLAALGLTSDDLKALGLGGN
jgi:hypothetical protein